MDQKIQYLAVILSSTFSHRDMPVRSQRPQYFCSLAKSNICQIHESTQMLNQNWCKFFLSVPLSIIPFGNTPDISSDKEKEIHSQQALTLTDKENTWTDYVTSLVHGSDLEERERKVRKNQ